MSTSTPASTRTPTRAAFGFIFATALMNAVSFGIVLPVLPNLIKAFAHGDTSLAAQWSTVFSVAWGAMQFVCGPLLGALSDRIGRRPVLLISLGGLAFDFFVMALAPNLVWLFVGRIVNGMTSASFATANAYIADVTAPGDRARAFGRIGAALSLGFLAGPVVGGTLASIDLRVPFYVAGVVTALNALYGMFVLPESLPTEHRTKRLDVRQLNPFGAFALLRGYDDLWVLCVLGALFSFAWMVGPSIFVLYGGYRYGWAALAVGVVMMASGGVGAFVQAAVVGPVVARLGERGTATLGASAAAIGYLGFGLASTGWAYLAAIPVFALHNVFTPALQALLTRRVDEREQARLQGLVQATQGVASVLGPLVFGMAFAWSTEPGKTPALSGSPFFLACAIMMLVSIGSIAVGKTPK